MGDGLNQIAFFRTYAEIFKSLNAEQTKELLDAIIDYAFYDSEPEFKNVLIKTTFLGIKNGVDASKKRAGNNNAKKEVEEKEETEENVVVERKNESFSKKKPVVLEKKTSPLLEKKKEKKKIEDEEYVYSRVNSTTSVNRLSVYKEIIEFFNSKTNTNYKYSTKKTQKKINARLDEGYTINDFKTVINKKVDEWKGTDMEKYLRPETIFGTKFESYLNQKIIAKKVISHNQHEQRKYEDLNKLYD